MGPSFSANLDVDDAWNLHRSQSAHSARGGDPLTLKEALGRSDAREWLEAVHEEYDAHQRNRTWELVELPPGAKAIDCKWVPYTKRKADGSVE